MLLDVQKKTAKSETGIPIVLLHGWGIGSAIWSSCEELLRERHTLYTIDMPGYRPAGLSAQFAKLDAWFCSQLPERYVLVGFSLGGVVATKLLHSVFSGAVGLLTVSTAPSFVANDQWPQAMPEAEFTGFAKLLEHDSQKLLQRFCSLQVHGAPAAKEHMKALKSKIEYGVPKEVLRFGLDCLREADLLTHWQQMEIPSLHQYGRFDRLVPDAVATQLSDSSMLPISIFEESSHVPFISETRRWVDSVMAFCRSVDNGCGQISEIAVI